MRRPPAPGGDAGGQLRARRGASTIGPAGRGQRRLGLGGEVAQVAGPGQVDHEGERLVVAGLAPAQLGDGLLGRWRRRPGGSRPGP